MFRSSDDHHQGAFWSRLKSLVKMWVFKCGYSAAYGHSFCMLYCAERHVDMSRLVKKRPITASHAALRRARQCPLPCERLLVICTFRCSCRTLYSADVSNSAQKGCSSAFWALLRALRNHGESHCAPCGNHLESCPSSPRPLPRDNATVPYDHIRSHHPDRPPTPRTRQVSAHVLGLADVSSCKWHEVTAARILNTTLDEAQWPNSLAVKGSAVTTGWPYGGTGRNVCPCQTSNSGEPTDYDNK
jgi:hypothetical protein